jgi:hypothetical protein
MVCRDCNRCHACCRCNPNEGRRWGTQTERYPSYLGIEIECGVNKVNTQVARALKKWGGAKKTDGSIHMTDRRHTLEFVTSPARGDSFVDQIKDFTSALHTCDATVNASCGLHCHVDAGELTDRQILNVAHLYYRIEPALYGIVARSRRSNHYSKAFSSHFGAKKVREIFREKDWVVRSQKLDTLLYGSLEAARRAKLNHSQNSDARYYGLNLNAIPLHGTIEFRLHQGTVNPTKILMWGAICSAIVRYGATHTEEEITSLPGSSIAILEKIVADPEVITWTRMRRRYFMDKDREYHGKPTIRRPQKMLVNPEHLSVPEEHGEHSLPIPEPIRAERVRVAV